MSRLVKSSLGSFIARSGLSLAEFLGIVYIATIAGPTVLGTYALFVAVYLVLSLFADLGLREAAIKRIAEGSSQEEFFAASLVTRLGLALPVSLGLLLFRGRLVSYIGYPAVVPYLLAILFLSIIADTLFSALQGDQKVARAELTLVTGSIGKLAIWIPLLWFGFGLTGLLIGLLVNEVLRIVVGLHFLSIRPQAPDWYHFRRLFQFSRYSWLGTVRSRAWIWTDTLVLSVFVAPSLVGVYELSWQISGAIFLLSSALGSVLYANVDRLLRREGTDTVSRAINESLAYSGVIAIPGLVGGVVVGDALLSAFGSTYSIGYPIFVVLLLARLLHSYEEIFANVVNALDRPDLIFRANGTFIVLNVTGNFVAVAAFGWIGAAVATAASMGVRTLLSYHYATSLIEVQVPTREILLQGVAALLMGSVLVWAKQGSSFTTAELGLVVVGGAAVYAASVLVLIGRIRGRVRSLLTELL